MTSARPTDDEIIARGDIWRGVVLELRQRLVEYTVDGVRFGTLLPETRSGSPHDRRLTKRSEEIITAAFVLGRLGYENVHIITKAPDGSDLERPDLDVNFEGVNIGLEVAQVSKRMKHDAALAVIEHTILDRIDDDAAFAAAFGPYNVTVSLSSVLAAEREITSKKQCEALANELLTFFSAGGHQQGDPNDPDDGWFNDSCTLLNRNGGTFYSTRADYGPHFGLMHGGSANPNSAVEEALRVLNDHRKQARTYRRRRNWIVMYLQDSNELFRRTVKAVSAARPVISPFDQCHITDASWNLASFVRRKAVVAKIESIRAGLAIPYAFHKRAAVEMGNLQFIPSTKAKNFSPGDTFASVEGDFDPSGRLESLDFSTIGPSTRAFLEHLPESILEELDVK